MREEVLKLDKFNKIIMEDVQERKQSIDKQVHDKLAKDFEEKELQFLQEAYATIQSGLKQIDREKNELLSKTLMENKVLLLNKRQSIIHEVFSEARKRIKAYTDTEAYRDKLIEDIKKHLEFMGEGDYMIYINYEDKEWYDDLVAAFPGYTIHLEKKYVDMLGGVKVHNLTTNLFIDDSMQKQLEEEEENFLQECGIEVEEQIDEEEVEAEKILTMTRRDEMSRLNRIEGKNNEDDDKKQGGD